MILLIDNYDSFTYNLCDYLAQLGSAVVVKRNDAITADEIRELEPSAIVISPGPGIPKNSGITMQVIEQFHTSLPILGICLGYQALGAYFGAEVVHSAVPFHGKTSIITLSKDPVFEGLPHETKVMRYHSLNISGVPDMLEIIAKTSHLNEPMALKHKTLPLYGFQFHPESILTVDGFRMLSNWFHTLPVINSAGNH